ncbi:MAG: hypothetical protein ABI678_04115, partial [Kofleriaceae bacterium]
MKSKTTPRLDRFFGPGVWGGMTTRHVWAGVLALAAYEIPRPAAAQPQQLATDRVEALMLATDGRPLSIHEE